MRAAEEGVRRGADAQLLLAARSISFRAILERDAERLFRIDMLAGIQRLQANRDVRLGHRQVQDDLDAGIGEERIDAHRLQPEFLARASAAAGTMSESPRMSRIGKPFAAFR